MKTTFVLGSLLALLSTSALAECPQETGYNGGADVLPACNAQQEQTTMRDEVQKPDSGNNGEDGQRITVAAAGAEHRYDCLGNPEE
jgi:hypothetical protein